MKKLKKAFFIILYTFAAILAILSIISLFRNSDIRYIKMLDFPRIQCFIVLSLTLLFIIFCIKKKRLHHNLLMVGLFIGIIINSVFLINYTKLVSVVVPQAQTLKSSETQFSMLVCNVKMTNRNEQPIIELIKSKKPDLILAMEVDDWWDTKLNLIKEEYPYAQHAVNEVTYGMSLYSKLPLKNAEVNYLTNENVPSFQCMVTLQNGKNITLHSMHPVPPNQFKNLPDNAGEQENALKKLGKKIKNRKLPTVVAGDLNDVVWSYVDDLTDTKKILYDLRVGRGFFNSFNAENFFMKWPLDHVFVTQEFKLKKLERLTKIGSDHYPIYVELVL